MIIVGAGPAGTSAALTAAKAGLNVVLLERAELTAGSTWHAAGLLPLFNMSYTVGQLHKYSVDLYKRLPAETALAWGLINRVHDDAVLMDEAMKLATELANGPTVALTQIRKLYWESPDNTFEEQLNMEFQCQRIAGSAEDFKEGVGAFLEKRPAKFKGR